MAHLPLYNDGAEIEAATEIDLGLEADLLRPKVRLEQRVTELFLLLRGPVYRYLVAVFGHPAEAEEITQEVFLRLHRCLHQGQAVGNVRSWAFRVAHNLAVDQHKNRKYLEPVNEAAWGRLCRARQDPAPNPEQRAIEREKLGRLRAAVARLSPQERQCLHLRAEGFRYREIAEVLGIGNSTVTDALRRGIQKLMKEGHD